MKSKRKAQNRADEGETRGSKLSIVMRKMGYKPSSNDGENDIKTVLNNAENRFFVFRRTLLSIMK